MTVETEQQNEDTVVAKDGCPQEKAGADYSIVRKYLTTCGLTSEISFDDFDPSSLSFLLDRSEKKIGQESTEEAFVPNEPDNADESPSDPATGSSNSTTSRSMEMKCCAQATCSQKEVAEAELSVEINAKDEESHKNTAMDQLTEDIQSIKAEVQSDEITDEAQPTQTTKPQEYADLNLEPWQKALFEKLDQQHQTIIECQRRIQSLEHMLAHGGGNHTPTFMEPPEPVNIQRDRDTKIEQIMQDSKRDEIPEIPQLANEQPQQQDRPNFVILSLLEAFIHGVFLIPRKLHGYVTSTRIYRIFRLIYREAEDHHRPGGPNARFLDMALLAKVIFVCFVFSARLHGKGVKKPTDGSWISAFTSFWSTYRLQLFIFCAVLTYFIQTGLLQFLYHIFIKDNVIRRVFNDEDLVAEQDSSNNDNGVARRRGRRDRAIDPNDGDRNLAEDQANAERRPNNPQNQNVAATEQAGANRNEFGNTFAAGAIEPRIANPDNVAGGAHSFTTLVKSFMLDLMYLFGSFFLSLIPLWQPKQREVVAINAEEEQQRGGEQEEGAAAAGQAIDVDDSPEENDIAVEDE